MHDAHEPEPANLEEMKYETRDLSIKSIVVSVAVLFALGLAAFVLTWVWIWPDLLEVSMPTNATASTLAVKNSLKQPQPNASLARIQKTPTRVISASSEQDMYALREQFDIPQNIDLEVPRWINKEQNIVSIPIKDAIQIVAKRGIAPKSMPVQIAPTSTPATTSGAH
jgi:hypothetical protein